MLRQHTKICHESSFSNSSINSTFISFYKLKPIAPKKKKTKYCKNATMANSRLLLRTSCNSKSPMSFDVSSSVINTIRCSTTPAKGGLGFNIIGDQNIVNGDNQSRQIHLKKDHTSAVKALAAVASSGSLVRSAATPPRDHDHQVHGGIFVWLMDLVSTNALLLLMLRNTADLINQLRNSFRKMQLQMFFEKVIVDCRFFTLFAVAGSLLASVLCFVEGCLVVLESYIHYFHTLSHKADQGHTMQLLIEAIDMFLVGTAMLMFGVGLYTMFVGSTSVKENGFADSNLFGLFHMKRVPRWVEMKSVSNAKSKLGHAVMMILQVGVLEKFKSVPLVTATDLACFAVTLIFSSASIFILSKLPAVTAR